MIEIRQTEEYARWFGSLRDRRARARIDVRIRRLSLGNPGDVKAIGGGVSELRIDHGPGYRVYFTQRGQNLVILLAGGDKGTQDRDIETALDLARGRQGASVVRTETRSWDVADHLETEEDMAAYLESALEDGDPPLLMVALGDIARAKGMAHVAQEAGLGSERLQELLSPDSQPEFATILKVIKALGLRLHASAVQR